MSFLDEQPIDPTFIDDKPMPVEDTMAMQNPNPLLVQAAMLAMTEKGIANSVDAYTKIANGGAPSINGVIEKTRQTAEQGLQNSVAALPALMTDPNLPMDKKMAMMEQVRSGKLSVPDLTLQVQSAAVKKPTAQDDYGDSVVLKNFEQLSMEAQDQWAERQAVVNAALSAKDGTFKKIADTIGIFGMPMGDAAMVAGVRGAATEQGLGEGSLLYSLALPGSSFAEFHKKFHTMGYDEQTAVLRQITDSIRTSSSLFTSDNNMRSSAFVSDLLDPEFSNFEKYFSNATNILDAVMIGQILRSPKAIAAGVKSGVKGIAGRFSKEEELRRAIQAERQGMDIPFGDEAIKRAPSSVAQGDLAKVSSTPQANVNQKRIDDLESKHSSILSENLTPLGRGEVTELEALQKQLQEKLAATKDPKARQRNVIEGIRESGKDIQSQLNRVEDALSQNKIAERNIQEISSIEKELTTLRKTTETVDAPLNDLTKSIHRAYMQSTVFTHHPRTAGNLLMNSNPLEARKVHMGVLMDSTDEAAQAVYGVSRNEAAIKAVAPQVTDDTGRIKFVTPDMEKLIRSSIVGNLDDSLLLDATGGLRFTESEIALAKSNIVKDYSSAVGLKLHPAMSAVQTIGDGSVFKIQAIYTPGDTGWLKASDAFEQAEFALRNRGITRENMTLMMRDGDEFVPVRADAVKDVEGEFLVRLDVTETIEAADIAGSFEKLDVRRNFFDRFFGSGTNWFGSLQSHLMPAANMLHKNIVGPAIVADDKTSIIAKTLLEKLDEFSSTYMKLDKQRQSKMMDYITEANEQSLKFDRTDLYANRGFTDPEIEALRNWREFWDMSWKLENLDLVKTLNNQGFQWMKTPHFTGAVKPRGKNYAITEVYDATADVYRPIDRQEIDQIYGMGGSIAELKRPMDVNGFIAEYVIVRNNPGEFARKLTTSDKVLEYREGYYQVHHNSPKFIEEKFVDSKGKTRISVIATAGNTEDAKRAVSLLQKRNPDLEYSYRGDEKGLERGSSEYWDLNTVGGRIAQRHRGKLLTQNVGLSSIGAANHVENPVSAGLRAASSISGRTATRPVLEAAKARFMDQYGHLVPAREGLKSFPDSLEGIVKKGEFSQKELADARTTWNYIRYLENGYINTVDSIYKKAMRWLSDGLGEAGYTKAESAGRVLEEASPMGTYKSTVFTAALGTNPLRQLMLQMNQGLRALPYNPEGFLSGSIARYFNAAIGNTFNIKLAADQEGFIKFLKETGMFQAISKHNLIRGTLLEASERTTRVGAALNTVPNTLRRVGFEQGERYNILTHSAAVYDEFVRAGKNVTDARVKAEMHDRIRAITLDMNFAGDMPYNQNALSFLMTYMQVPHKALGAMGNRRIPPAVRNRMMAFDLMMWGLPTEAIGKAMDIEGISPENPELRRLVEDGLQSWYLNKMMSLADPETNGADFSSLNPHDWGSWMKMFEAVWGGGADKVLDSSAGSKIVGTGMDSRIGVALNMTGEFFKDFYEETDSPTRVLDVLDSWGRVSSGWNNFQKARMQWALGVATDKYGNVTDSHVSKAEAVAQAFGWGSEDTRDYYNTLKVMKDEKKFWKQQAKDDVDKMRQLMNIKVNGRMTDVESIRFHSKMIQSTPRFINPKFRADYVNTVAQQYFSDPDSNMWKELASTLGYVDSTQIVDAITRSPGISEEQKAKAINIFQGTRKSMEQIKKENQ